MSCRLAPSSTVAAAAAAALLVCLSVPALAQPEAEGPPPEATATATADGDPVEEEDGPCLRPTPRQDATVAVVSLGFSHWYGGTFGAPVGTYTPGVSLALVALEWLEVGAAYSVSVLELPLPNGTRSPVGFATASLMLRRELQVAGERLTMAGGILGGVVHTHEGLRAAFGGSLAARYLIAVGSDLSLGPFVEARALLYELPGSDLPIYEIRDGRLEAGHSDMHLQIGVAFAL